MADMKKYVSLAKLNLYHGKLVALIDSKDAAVLAAAKKYAEDLGLQYDAAGSAAGVLEQLEAEIARAKAAEEANAAAAKQAQDEVDALEQYVGTIPETATAKDIVGYVQEKTAGIATDTALEELTGRVATAEGAIDAIEADYLKAADKTELSDAIAAEKTRAEGIEGGLRTDVDAVKADYLKSTDKTELQGNIDAVSGKVTTLIGEDADKSVRTIANEELAKQLIAEGAKESLDTLAEIAAWIQSHPDDASAMNKAIEDLEALVGTLPEGVTATTVVGYIQEVIAAEKTRAEGIEAGLAERIATLEGNVGEGGSVDEKIAAAVRVETDARVEAVAGVQADADKGIEDAAAALQAAQDASAHADELNGAMDTRMQAVEGKAHEHANKAELDLIATGDKAKWDAAAAIAHEHANKTVLDGISAEKVTAWDKVSEKADQTALQAEIERAQAAEKANADAIALFVEVSEEEINGLFA